MLVQTLSFVEAHRRPPRPEAGGAGPFSRGRTAGWASDPRRWIWWERKKIGARPSSFPPSDPSAIPTSTVTAPPWRKRGRHARNAGENTILKEFSGNEVYAVEATTNASSRPPREPTLHASLPIRPRKLCVSRSFDVVWEHIVYNMISFRPYVPLSLPRLRHTGAFYVAGLVTWQTTVNKTHRT